MERRQSASVTDATSGDAAIRPDDLRNGWTFETLAKYRAEREAAHQLVAGNVVTPFKRPRPVAYLIGAKSFNPHKW